MSWRQRLTSASAWSDVAHNFRGDWQMLWKEITIGFLLAGFVAQLGNGFFNSLFLKGSPAIMQSVWGAVIGPVIAVLSFVCSVGNVPLAAVLWSGGISFAGVMAFIFADLIVLPIISIYVKYYGRPFALRITGLMFVTMAAAALIIDGLFSALGLIPSGARPTRADIFSTITVNYKLFLNIAGLLAFVALFWLTARRGATDPVCGMKVDRTKAITKSVGGETFYFCSEHCLHAFQADPDRYTQDGPAGAQSTDGHDHHAHGHHDHAHRHASAEEPADVTIDPVCGMTVDPEHALSADHDQQTYYFCSAGCRERFLADPAGYVPGAHSRIAHDHHDAVPPL